MPGLDARDRGDGDEVAIPRYDELMLRDAAQVVAVLHAGAWANLHAACRRGSIDVVVASGGERLIATGDLHDNALHMRRLVRAASLEDAGDDEVKAHLTLHEVIHGEDGLINDMDFSYRALVRVAALKARHPEHVHALLANHELSQIVGAGVMKDGVNCVRAFNDAVTQTFGDHAAEVRSAIEGFIRSMPLALRFETPGRTVLCAHTVPGPELMDRFDLAVLERDLTDEDYTPRWGSAHIMVWGRNQTPALMESLASRWDVGLFVLGHEKAEAGVLELAPNAVVLNSDHASGAYLELIAGEIPATVAELAPMVRRLAVD
jgi:hypothetical protein